MNEYRPIKFQILPDVVKNLLILNGLMFLATIAAEQFGVDLTAKFALFYIGSDYFHPYQFVTHMFMHGGLFHIFFNMFMLWMFGSKMENLWGPKRFLFFYFFCGLGSAIVQSTVSYIEINYIADAQRAMNLVNVPIVGASGAIMGVLIAFGLTFPNTILMLLFPPLPIRAKYLILILILIDIIGGITNLEGNVGADNIAHFAHLGGALFGYILLKYWSRKRYDFY